MEYTCPACEAQLGGHINAADPDNPEPPKDGDICVCSYCSTVVAFEKGEAAMLIGEDLRKVMTSPEVVRARLIVLLVVGDQLYGEGDE
ncbi:hypothetical protein PP996_gp57 [Gordonia phage SheckWes]|uniref:Uncharacterized protein n=1 Tax=Gordonia phage SheckWes TaxID=2591117 RepID=A0A515MII8_9CAUD|nr:hypothetical protein PP996_gp57 [Gordonia phage SheckWes]QDM56483.1 hypothetical protein SEA_SHECKWES_57 [Gordonia phage SheckWes]